MKIDNLVGMTDKAILTHIGKFIRATRLELSWKQGELATKAGIHRTTLSDIENGGKVQLLTLIQLLRALGKIDVLDVFSTEKVVSPIQLATYQSQERQRVRNSSFGESPQSEW